jgi:O-antigen/teichoic acid export membrane protein
MAGTVAVAVYGLGGTLNSMYLNFSTAISNVFVPQVNKMVAEHDDNRELTYLFTRVGRVQFILLSLIISGFIFFGHSFIIFWGGKEYASSYYVGLLLMIPVTVPLIQNLGIEIQRAKNMHKARSIAYLIIAILNVFLSIPLIKLWGEIGAALGTAISLIVGNVIFMNWYYQNRVNLDILYFWREIFKFTPGLLIPIIVGCLEHYFLPIDQKIILLVGIIIYTAVFCLSMWFFGMNEYEKDLLKPYLRKVHILK